MVTVFVKNIHPVEGRDVERSGVRVPHDGRWHMVGIPQHRFAEMKNCRHLAVMLSLPPGSKLSGNFLVPTEGNGGHA